MYGSDGPEPHAVSSIGPVKSRSLHLAVRPGLPQRSPGVQSPPGELKAAGYPFHSGSPKGLWLPPLRNAKLLLKSPDGSRRRGSGIEDLEG